MYIYMYIYTHTYIYISTYTYIYICTYTYTFTHIHTHIHMHIYTYTYTYTHNHTHTNPHTCTYINLFVNCSEIPHAQIPHYVSTSQLNPSKSQITGFHKTQNTREGNSRTESSKKVNKSGLK